MSYADINTQNIRLIILRDLNDSYAYTSNDSVLRSVLELYGQPVSRDRVRTELTWLADQGLVALIPIGESGSYRVTLTGAGIDVALGKTTNPGVQRPTPRL